MTTKRVLWAWTIISISWIAFAAWHGLQLEASIRGLVELMCKHGAKCVPKSGIELLYDWMLVALWFLGPPVVLLALGAMVRRVLSALRTANAGKTPI